MFLFSIYVYVYTLARFLSYIHIKIFIFFSLLMIFILRTLMMVVVEFLFASMYVCVCVCFTENIFSSGYAIKNKFNRFLILFRQSMRRRIRSIDHICIRVVAAVLLFFSFRTHIQPSNCTVSDPYCSHMLFVFSSSSSSSSSLCN